MPPLSSEYWHEKAMRTAATAETTTNAVMRQSFRKVAEQYRAIAAQRRLVEQEEAKKPGRFSIPHTVD